MRKTSPFKKARLHTAVGGLLSLSMLSGNGMAADGMIESLSDYNVNDTQFMQDLGLTVGGWLSFGATYNADNPDDNNNTPVTFNDRHGEFQGNQLNVFIERAVNEGGDAWDLGFRADILYGTDARFTQAAGLDDELIGDDFRFYKLAFPQFYLQGYAPILNGVTATVGHFYTIIGNEVVTAPDNFFYSHAYTMQYGEPFTHTGALLSTPINDNISVKAGAVLGWDNFSTETDIWNFLGGVNWSSDSGATSLAITGIQGAVSEDNPNHDRWLYSIVLSHDITEKLHYLIQHDHGREEIPGGNNAEGYAVNQYLTFDVNDEVSTGIRAEWFRDDDGTRVTGAVGSYYAVTAGLNWSPVPWFKIRPEARYDWFDGTGDPYDGGTESSQFTVATDVVVVF
ncbi:MAG: porin [Pseudomonadota bacterium]